MSIISDAVTAAKVVPSLCVALSLALGCGNDGHAPAKVAVTDSSGIEIVESGAPAWSVGEEWSVDGTPVMSVGGPALWTGIHGRELSNCDEGMPERGEVGTPRSRSVERNRYRVIDAPE